MVAERAGSPPVRILHRLRLHAAPRGIPLREVRRQVGARDQHFRLRSAQHADPHHGQGWQGQPAARFRRQSVAGSVSGPRPARDVLHGRQVAPQAREDQAHGGHICR